MSALPSLPARAVAARLSSMIRLAHWFAFYFWHPDQGRVRP
jgi:hypothetical protein